MKKPPMKVRAITGQYKQDVVRQAELTELGALQVAAWQAHNTAGSVSEEIDRRFREGAGAEPGEWYFDRELKMARRQKQRTG